MLAAAPVETAEELVLGEGLPQEASKPKEIFLLWNRSFKEFFFFNYERCCSDKEICSCRKQMCLDEIYSKAMIGCLTQEKADHYASYAPKVLEPRKLELEEAVGAAHRQRVDCIAVLLQGEDWLIIPIEL